jgi:LPXTG-motif cell wall-anchored protein
MRKLTVGTLAGLLMLPTVLVATASTAQAEEVSTARAGGCVEVTHNTTSVDLRLKVENEDCVQRIVNVTTYQLPKTYDGSGNFNPSAAPQTMIKNRTVTITRDSPEQTVPLDVLDCGWYQWDAYTGPVLEVVTPAGHGSRLIKGWILKGGDKECGPTPTPTSPTPTPTSPTPTPTTPTDTPTPTPTTPTDTPTSPTPTTTTDTPTPTTGTDTPTPTGSTGGGNPPSGTPTSGGPILPHTGFGPTPFVLIGLLLLVGGGLLAKFTRSARATRSH